jgi:hypothetical protein
MKMALLSEPEQQRIADQLYERYGRPLEDSHRGQYIAIASNGSYLLAPTLVEAVVQSAAELGPGNFVFKVGDRVVGSWR